MSRRADAGSLLVKTRYHTIIVMRSGKAKSWLHERPDAVPKKVAQRESYCTDVCDFEDGSDFSLRNVLTVCNSFRTVHQGPSQFHGRGVQLVSVRCRYSCRPPPLLRSRRRWGRSLRAGTFITPLDSPSRMAKERNTLPFEIGGPQKQWMSTVARDRGAVANHLWAPVFLCTRLTVDYGKCGTGIKMAGQ